MNIHYMAEKMRHVTWSNLLKIPGAISQNLILSVTNAAVNFTLRLLKHYKN
jgi:hypothetical protein